MSELSEAEYKDVILSQLGMCLLCAKVKGRALIADHNPRTGKLRAYLCKDCKDIVSKTETNPKVNEKAAKYIWVHNHLSETGATP